MTSSGRVDQTSVAGTLRDHRARIRALEALNPNTGGGCGPWEQWSDLGSGAVTITANTDCTPVIAQPDVNLSGTVWTCDFDALASLDPPPGFIQGSVTAIFIDPGTADPGDCADAFFNFYLINPPWVTGAVGAPLAGVPTGFGFTYQQSTRTMLPAQLVWNATVGPGWGVMVAGTELSNDVAGLPSAGWNMARPNYPFEYTDGDTLFIGSFLYNPVLTA